MPHDLTHASFFTGVGGLDLGLERAGWRTVSHCEVDPYACAVLAARWPGVPNLGDIVQLGGGGRERQQRAHPGDWRRATLWSGGFPCQDLSVAGRRAGLAGERSGLAFAFLDLVGRHKPEWVLMENVPGLLSSHSGRDLGALLRVLGDAGYGWAYRVLDAQWLGVPQRRRRVLILAHHAGGRPDAVGPSEVLAVGTRCGRDHAAEREAWARAAGRAGRGAGIVGQAISAKWAKRSSGPAGDEHHNLVVGTIRSIPRPGSNSDGAAALVRPPADPDRVRAAPGLAGRVDGRAGMAFAKAGRAQSADDGETWGPGVVSPTLNSFDVGDARATALAVVPPGPDGADPDPDGLDSHRYRVTGNGVAAPMAEWVGRRLAAWVAGVS